MNWRGSLSTEEVQEIYDDACAAYQAEQIDVSDFRLILGQLGHNATEIEDAERFYRPVEAEGEADPD